MTRIKVTKKAMKEFENVFSVGYCGAQNLLRGCKAFAYSAGVYGWQCDYYNIDDCIICTGYTTTGKNANTETTSKAEEKARKIWEDWGKHYDERAKKVEKIRKKWLEELKKGDAVK